MNMGVLTGLAVLCTTVPIGLVVMIFAYRSRSLPGVSAFLAVTGLALWWSICYCGELFTPIFSTKLIWSNLQFLSITLLPIAFLAMALRYTNRGRWLTRLRLVILLAVPLVTNVLLWTDNAMLRSLSWLDTSGSYPVIGRVWGPWFWVHAAYSYVLLTLAVLVLIAAVRARPRLRDKRLTAVLIGTLIPVAGSLMETLVPSSSPVDDLTPALFTFSLLLLAWGLLRVRIFNLVPVARHALVETMRDGLLVLNTDGQVVDINESACRLIGLPKTQILGQPLPECWDAWEQVATAHSAGAQRSQLRVMIDGHEHHYEITSSPLAQHGQVLAQMLVLSDVTDRVLLEDSLRDQALTDSLTGLPNRGLFMTRLGDTMRQALGQDDVLFAVLVVDLDRFKLINDTLGHLAGDALLQSVAAKLRHCVRDADTVARMGGDEFIILLHEISDERDLLPILRRIRTELRTPVYFGRQEMVAASSVGVAIWDRSYTDPEDIVRAADTAMYQAKEDGRDCYRVFDEEMHRAIARSLSDETELRSAIREGAFSVIYQPLINLASRDVHSIEALLRWHHPDRGTILPRDFLSVAENSGLIVTLGEIALDKVFDDLDRFPSEDERFGRLPVRVNVSPRQLTEPDFVSSVLSRLEAWQIGAERLILEVTENAFIRDPSKARQAMKGLQGLGVRLCLDDFGTGRSSLQHLTTLPVQDLKIDPLYVAGVAPGSRDLEIIRHIAALAHTLGLTVTAEGVESAEQLELLAEAGCDLAQGYYVANPMEIDALLEFLSDSARMQAGSQTQTVV